MRQNLLVYGIISLGLMSTGSASANPTCSSIFQSNLPASVVVNIDGSRQFLDFHSIVFNIGHKAILSKFEHFDQSHLGKLFTQELESVLATANGVLSPPDLLRFVQAVHAFTQQGGKFVVDLTADPQSWNQSFRTIGGKAAEQFSEGTQNGIEIFVPYQELVLSLASIGDARAQIVLNLAHELRHFNSWSRIYRRLQGRGVEQAHAWNYQLRLDPAAAVLETKRFEEEAREIEQRLGYAGAPRPSLEKFVYPEMETLSRISLLAAGDLRLAKALDDAANKILEYISYESRQTQMSLSFVSLMRGYLRARESAYFQQDLEFPFEYFAEVVVSKAFNGIHNRNSLAARNTLETQLLSRFKTKRVRTERLLRDIVRRLPSDN